MVFNRVHRHWCRVFSQLREAPGIFEELQDQRIFPEDIFLVIFDQQGNINQEIMP
jgi:hypothetical protein